MPWLIVILVVLVEPIFFSVANPGVEPDGWSCFVGVLLVVTPKLERGVLEVRGRIPLIVRIPSSPLDFVVQIAVKHTRREYFLDLPF